MLINLLVVPRVLKSRMGARAFSYQAPLLWNQLPPSVLEADTVTTFKSRFKTFLFDSFSVFLSLRFAQVQLLEMLL